MEIAHIFANNDFESRGIKFNECSKKYGIKVLPFFRRDGQTYLDYALSTAKQILAKDVKIIHAHRISGFIPAIFVKLLKPSVKIIYDKHDIHKYDFIFDRLMFLSSYVLTASDLHLAHVKKFKKDCEVIPNYSDFKPVDARVRKKLRKEAGIRDDEVVVLFQGSIVREYGLDLLINALPKINTKVKIIILGWLKDPEYWELIKEKLTDRVIYLGPRPYSQMNKYVGSADIGVVLFKKSKLTMFGNPAKLFEFISCKIPVVVTDIQCVSKYIKKYHNGLIARTQDDLAEAINKLSDKKIREKYSLNSPKLSFEQQFKKYLLILNKLKNE